MARSKEFDVDAALDRALDTFWTQGYEATSMQALLDAMGIHRGSFYDTFGSKRDVMVAALRLYVDRSFETFVSLRDGRCGRAAILAFFDWVADDCSADREDRGCFLVNTALEVAPHDPEIRRLVRSVQRRHEAYFRKMLEEAQEAGELGHAVEPAAAAQALLALVLGVRVLARSGAPQHAIRSITLQAEAILG